MRKASLDDIQIKEIDIMGKEPVHIKMLLRESGNMLTQLIWRWWVIFPGEWDQPAAYAETHCDPPRSILKASIVRKTDRRYPYELLYIYFLWNWIVWNWFVIFWRTLRICTGHLQQNHHESSICSDDYFNTCHYLSPILDKLSHSKRINGTKKSSTY